jgi:hypothetical protein
VKNILTPEQYQRISSEEVRWPVYVELTNGKISGCDIIVSAIGVTPNVELFLQSANVKKRHFFDFIIICYITFSLFWVRIVVY